MDIGPDDAIDHDGMIAPYRQLAAILQARIKRHDWEPGRSIPSEARLMQEYGLARTTVRRAIAALAKDGLVVTVPQRGTFVATRPGARENETPQ